MTGFLLVNKVYSPQYVLWLLPLVALARPRWRDVLIWTAGEVFYFGSVWLYLGGWTQSASVGQPDRFYWLAILVRMAVEVYIAVLVVRDVLMPWHDPVRADGLTDDPAEPDRRRLTRPAPPRPPRPPQRGPAAARPVGVADRRTGYEQCMRALTTVPLQANTLDVVDVPDPEPQEGDLLVDAIAVGVCGTDKEIARGEYGWAPPGRERLVLGHESFGRVRQAPDGSGFAAGDLVVGVVRRPDPEPCGACAHGEFDMCRNGKYTERGHQADRRVRQRAVDGRGRLRGPAGRGAGRGRDADGADHGRGQGLGAGRADRPRGRGSSRRRCWSPARGRSGCSRRCSGSSAGSTCTCSTR